MQISLQDSSLPTSIPLRRKILILEVVHYRSLRWSRSTKGKDELTVLAGNFSVVLPGSLLLLLPAVYFLSVFELSQNLCVYPYYHSPTLVWLYVYWADCGDQTVLPGPFVTSRAIPLGILPSRSLNNSNSVHLMSRVLILLFVLFIPLRILYSTALCLLQKEYIVLPCHC